MPEWLTAHLPEGWTAATLIWVGVGLFVVTFFGSILAVAAVVVYLPPDYFASEEPPKLWQKQHWSLRWTLIGLKNVLGFVLVVVGIVLSLPGVPGQGLLTILIGAMMMDFPGKRRAERWLVSRRGVLTTLNRLRARFKRPPLIVGGIACPTDVPPAPPEERPAPANPHQPAAP